nr:hypothetical protein CFP56_02044 [Quercus suber]
MEVQAVDDGDGHNEGEISGHYGVLSRAEDGVTTTDVSEAIGNQAEHLHVASQERVMGVLRIRWISREAVMMVSGFKGR